MAGEKKSTTSKMQHHEDGGQHDCCFDAIEALTGAARAVAKHQACCDDNGHAEGVTCCKTTLSGLLDGIEAYTAHVRDCCDCPAEEEE